jgi:hypothetical protein
MRIEKGLMKKIILGEFRSWKSEILHHKYLILISLFLLIIATLLDYISGNYVQRVTTAVAPALILDHIRPVDLTFVFVYFYGLVFFLLFFYPIIFRVKEIHVVISQFSLLVAIRGIFMCFTHLKAPVDAIAVNFPWIASHLSFQNDLFFSGHTAIPFLGFLLFKDEKIRYFFLASSIILGVTVLLMHIHYSIDVFSAFFITYGSYKIGEWAFTKINHYRQSW